MKKISRSIFCWLTFGLLLVALCTSVLFYAFRTETSAAWDGSVAASFASGSGTESNPYLVKTNAQMGYFLKQLASGVTYSGLHIRLENNLNMTGATWNYTHGYAFEGTFNGNGYTITADCPLFDSIGTSGVLKGLNYTTIQTQVNRALLCNVNNGTIDSCVCYGDVYYSAGSDVYASMICNDNKGTVANCGAIGKVAAAGDDASARAAMICKNTGTISNCFSALTVSASAPGKYNTAYKNPLTLGTAPTGCYYDKTLYTGSVSSGLGLTTEQMQGSAFLSSLVGTSVVGTNWVVGSHGYPAVSHCSSTYAYVNAYESETSIVYFATYQYFTLEASNSSATIYYTLDGSDPTSSTTRKSVTSGKTITITGNAVLTMVPYNSGSYGSISQVDITFLPGEGSASNPYKISTTKQLKTLHMFPDKCFKLVSNITFQDDDYELGGMMAGGWNPVSNFSGLLDGNEYAIINLRGQNGGLVSTNSGTITALRLLDHKLYKYGDYGAIAKSNTGTISYCYVRSGFTLSTLPSAANSAAYEVGGIVANNWGTLTHCRHEGITLYTGGARYYSMNHVGGICGYNSGTLSHCVNTGLVVLMNYEHTDDGGMGGIVGRGNATNCISNTDFLLRQSFDYPLDVGGIAGWYQSVASYSIAKKPTCTWNLTGSYMPPSVGLYTFAYYSNYCYDLDSAQEPSDCPELDFETNWMLTDEGLVPQGVMDADGHCYVPNGEVTLSTCIQNGTVPVICLTCGKTETQSLELKDHSFADATCTTPKTCSVCGETEGDALGHSYENHFCTICDEPDEDVVAYGTCGENLTWLLTNDNTLTISGTGVMEDYTSDGTPWVAYKRTIQTIVIEEGVTSIGDCAFKYFESLDQLVLPDSLTSIGYESFLYCPSLTHLEFPKNLRTIEIYAFEQCYGLESVVFPEGMTSIIGFNHCTSLKTVTIPESVTEITFNAFNNCSALTDVYYHGTKAQWEQIKIENPDSYNQYFANATVHYTKCNAGHSFVDATCSAPKTCSVCGTTEGEALGHDLIQHDGQLPTCTEIGWEAYETCSRCNHSTYVEIPSVDHDLTQYEAKAPTCTEIGWEAYEICSRCDHNTYVELPAEGHDMTGGDNKAPTCTEAGYKINECTRCDYEEKTEVPAMGHSWVEATCSTPKTCSNCGETEGTIKNHNWGEIVVVVEPTCTEDGYNKVTCEDCGATSHLPVAALGHSYRYHLCTRCGEPDEFVEAYGECGEDLTWVLTEDGELTIFGTGNMYMYYFDDMPWVPYIDIIETAIIQDGVTSIGSSAFYDCTSLISVTIGSDVTEIGDYAFRNCHRLESVTIPNGVATIGEQAFAGCISMSSVTIPNSVTNLGEGALSECTSLTSVSIPNGMTSVPNSLLSNCTNLISVAIPDSVTSIGDGAFFNCPNLTDVTIPHGVVRIGSYAFFECGFTELEIPSSVNYIGTYAFQYCRRLTNVVIPNSVTRVEWYAFANCSNLISVTISEGMTYLDKYVFLNCNNLTTVTIPEGITRIYAGAFEGCSSLQHVLYKGTEEAWNAIGIGANDYLTSAICHYNCTGDEIVDGVCTICNPPCSHNWDDATCTNPKTCSLCGLTDGVALGHDYTAVVTDPTCTDLGYTIHTCHCGDSYTDSYVEALEHDLTQHEAKDPTCTEIGWEAYETCSRCDHNTYVELPAEGHDYDSVVTDPTCTERGYTTHTCHCGDSYVDSYEDALDHDLTQHDAKAPTCTEIGWEAYEVCSRCDHNTYVEIPAEGHDYDSVVIDPTCTERGYTTHACHCGDSYVDSYEDALEHDLTQHDAKAPTCTEIGWEAYETCSRCDHNTYVELPAERHDYDSVVTDPTCTEFGYTTHTCSRCMATYTTDHVDALGHDWDEGVVTMEPTVEAEGEKTYTCQTCGETETETLPKKQGVHYDVPDDDSITIPENDCFEDGTTVTVEEILTGDLFEQVSEIMKQVAENYMAFEFTATKGNEEVQPNGKLTVTFKLPGGYSDNVTVYYMTVDGSLEELNVVVDTVNRTVTAEMEHFSTYILVDMDSQVAQGLKGDLDLDGDVDAEDLTILARHVAGIETLNDDTALANADVDGDGDIDANDLTMHARYVAGIINEWEDNEA